MERVNEDVRTKIIVRAWKDPRFKEKLLKDPRAVMKEYGVVLPENVQVRCVENTSSNVTFVLPSVPADSKELSEEELHMIAGGRSRTQAKYPAQCR